MDKLLPQAGYFFKRKEDAPQFAGHQTDNE